MLPDTKQKLCVEAYKKKKKKTLNLIICILKACLLSLVRLFSLKMAL